MGGMTLWSWSLTPMFLAGSMAILLRRAIEIGGLAIPVLTFALIHAELQGAAVGAVEGLIDVEDGLNGVLTGWDTVERLPRITERGSVDGDGARGVDVHSKHLLAGETFVDLLARFPLRSGRNDEDDVAVHRLLPADFEVQRGFGLSGYSSGAEQE